MAITQREHDLVAAWGFIAKHIYPHSRENVPAILDLGRERLLDLIPQVPGNMPRIVDLTTPLGNDGFGSVVAQLRAKHAREWVESADIEWEVDNFFNDYED